MSKVSEVLTMLERSRALGLSAEVQATLDAAILAEMGIQRKSAPMAVQLDIFAARFEPSTTSSSTSSTTSSSTDAPTPEERAAALAHKKREAVRLRMMYAEWMWSDPTLRQIGEWIGQAVKVAGSQRALALLLGVTGSIIESYLGGFTMPGAREARIIAGLIRLPEELVVSMCDAAGDHLDELRAAQGLRRAVRRSFSNPPFSGEE
jgi:DNA-binding transcriptional regulator YdaS (Cro superfamily)